MLSSYIILFTGLLGLTSVFAGYNITSPTSGTAWVYGQANTLSWNLTSDTPRENLVAVLNRTDWTIYNSSYANLADTLFNPYLSNYSFTIDLFNGSYSRTPPPVGGGYYFRLISNTNYSRTIAMSDLFNIVAADTTSSSATATASTPATQTTSAASAAMARVSGHPVNVWAAVAIFIGLLLSLQG